MHLINVAFILHLINVTDTYRELLILNILQGDVTDSLLIDIFLTRFNFSYHVIILLQKE